MQSIRQKPPVASDSERGLTARLSELRHELKSDDPYILADRCGMAFCGPNTFQAAGSEILGFFSLSMWGRPLLVSFPAFDARWQPEKAVLGLLEQGLLLYYLACCDGTPHSGQWISFSELPDGRFYNRAFQGYTGAVLEREFGDRLEIFTERALARGGTPCELGDAAFAFQVLPHVPILAVAWLGDEDFPTRYQVLFDACISHHLPTDGCAILGSALVRRLLNP